MGLFWCSARILAITKDSPLCSKVVNTVALKLDTLTAIKGGNQMVSAVGPEQKFQETKKLASVPLLIDARLPNLTGCSCQQLLNTMGYPLL